MMYLYKSVDWEPIRDMHGAIIREIERGNRSWNDSFLDFEVRMLQSQSVKSCSKQVTSSSEVSKIYSSRSKGYKSGVIFCKKYQKGQCTKEGAHNCYVLNY